MTNRPAVRERLPNCRASESFTFEVNGLLFTATISRFTDGRIGELFLNNHKYGNQSDTNARDAAILLSFALQHGADIEAVRRARCAVTAKGTRLGRSPSRSTSSPDLKAQPHAEPFRTIRQSSPR